VFAGAPLEPAVSDPHINHAIPLTFCLVETNYCVCTRQARFSVLSCDSQLLNSYLCSLFPVFVAPFGTIYTVTLYCEGISAFLYVSWRKDLLLPLFLSDLGLFRSFNRSVKESKFQE
jgi:hypothetical protein